jgi:uncharacterized repeat protein (TIGR02543 family)
MKIRKRLLSITLALLMALMLLPVTAVPAQATEPTGYWTDEGNISLEEPPYNPDTNTYTITTAGELAWVAKVINDNLIFFSDDIFELGDNIDLSGHFWVPIGTLSPQQEYFGCTFDGNGKTISNMTIGTESSPATLGEIGLFGYVNKATIKDVELTNVSIYADEDATSIKAGGLVGIGSGCTISAISVSGVIDVGSTSSYSGIGGIAGELKASGMAPDFIFTEVENCSSSVSIRSRGTEMSAGGLIGRSEDSYITNCYSTENIWGLGAKYAGGLIGFAANSGEVTDSYALGDVSAAVNTDFYREAGGLIGHSYFDVENCFALGNVEGGIAGGLIGYGRAGTIKNSFALGNIYAPGIVGGLVGISANSGLDSIINCYAVGDIETTSTPYIRAGGLIGQSNSADTVITNAYWNSDAKQTVNGAERTAEEKKGIVRIEGLIDEIDEDFSTARSGDEMTSSVFAALLNENKGGSRSWMSVNSINGGYPYHEGLYYATPTYTVTFVDWDGQEIKTQTVVHGSGATAPAAPERVGYTFTGWDAAFDSVTKDLTVTAVYTVNQYTITFNSSGGSDVASITLDYGATITAPVAPTKESYTFAGWVPELPATMPANNLAVTAQWTAETYTVTFDSKGGSEVAPITGIAKDATVTLPATPTKAGYVFAGWNTEADGTGIIYNAGATYIMGSVNVVFYAKWTQNTPHSDDEDTYIPPQYLVTDNNQGTQAGGQLRLSSGRAEAGKTIIITVTPDMGYENGIPTVLDKSGNPVTVTDNGNGTFSFKMPAGAATVDMKFIKTTFFDDVSEDDWFGEAAWFCAANGLMKGIGNKRFDGNSGTDRAMLVTVLYRLANSTDSLENIFTDVEDKKWYSEAIAWAAHNKIVEGYGNGEFGPTDILTREQMVTILYRFSNFMKYNLSKHDDLQGFNDTGNISDWAFSGMQWAVGNDIVGGMGSDIISPNSGATRAQFAVMMQRFCTNFVK